MDQKRQLHTNGSLGSPKALNGVNGVNGVNGHAMSSVQRRTTPPRKQRGLFARLLGTLARLLTWYSIVTILFRCPASLSAYDQTSPKICKPYFHSKDALVPHVKPYYDAYAAPYIDLTRPYYETLDRSVLTPGRAYAVKYGGPRVAQVQAFGYAQWQKNVHPQILKYQSLAKDRYHETISPYVNRATATAAPYYEIAQTNALQTYHEVLVPAYTFVQPYAVQGYDAAYDLTKNTVIPSTVWAWKQTYAFLDAAVWPHVRDVYVLKVEPQLVRIGQRLGRYNEKKPKAAGEEAGYTVPRSTFVKPTSSVLSTPSSSAADPVQTTTQTQKATESHSAQLENSKVPKTKEEIREQAAKTVAEDLEVWEGKFSRVAEEGAAEIEDRVDDISIRMIQQHAGTMGKSLVAQLERTTESELESLKKAILTILVNDKEEPERRDAKIAAAVRNAGLNIKNKAQNIRDWRHSYEQETEIAVTKAAEEHFSILDQTRDLALQKIGMKWAWMDGVTYKDWQKYHQLRARFDEWTEDLKQLVTSHPGLAAAQAAGTDIENEGMAIAHEAAIELGRLRQVAAWKATAEDYTDDFDSSTMELAAEAAEKWVAAAVESARLAPRAVVDEAATVVDAAVESLSEAVSDTGSAEDDKSSSFVVGNEEEETTTISLSQNERQQEDLDSTPLPPPGGSATEFAEDAPEPEQLEETILESADLPIHSVKAEANPTPLKPLLFGAAAESVPSRQPVLEDDAFSTASSVLSVAQSDIPASITSAAQSAYTAAIAEAANQYSRAMSAVSVQVSGEPKPFHEGMLSSVSNGYFKAMAAANSQLNEAMAAASGNLYGTPSTNWAPAMPTVPSVDWERVQSIAQQRLHDSVNWASQNYESAKVAIGAAEPTPSSYLEEAEQRAQKLLDQAKHNYFAGVGIAHARYSEFLSAASTAVSSLTATATPTNIQESASSAISVAGEAAESVASYVQDQAGDVKDSIDESWDLLVSRVSSQVYGAPTPTPWYENLYAAAADYASHVDELAASATNAVVDQVSAVSAGAGDYAASANAAASSQYVAVSVLVSELLVGKEPSYTESVYSRLAHAYTTGLASVSSLGSVASASAASAASKISDAASSGMEAGSETIASVTDKVKDAAEHIKDEL